MAKKSKFWMLKGTIIAGLLIGVIFKAWEFIVSHQLYCGVFIPKGCNKDFVLYLKDLGLTVLVTILATMVVVYCLKFIIKLIFENLVIKPMIEKGNNADSARKESKKQKTAFKKHEKKEDKEKDEDDSKEKPEDDSESDEIIKI